MSSINWRKVKSAEEVKALFRHDEREKREDTEFHRNFHIDKSKTHLNCSIIGRRYTERCNMYDEAVQSAEAVMASSVETYVPKSGKNAGKTMQRKKSKLRKDTVTALNMCVPVPKDLPLSEYYRWFKAVHDIEAEFFGEENVIDSDIHFDEIHEYFDTFLKEWVMSRVHMHTTVIPRTADGRLCCNDIFTRENCKKLNDLIEEMTQREFGIAFNTGETPRGETVEDLKSKSYAAELKLFNELEAKIAELEEHKAKLYGEISDSENRLEELNAEISDREEYKKKIDSEIADSTEYLDALKAEEPNSLERIEELDAEILVKEGFLESLNTRLSISEQYLNETNGEISEREERKNELDTELSEREKRKKELDEELSEITSDINAAKPVAEAAVKEVYELDKKIQEQQQQITDGDEKLQKINDDIAERKKELNFLDAQKAQKLEEMENYKIQTELKIQSKYKKCIEHFAGKSFKEAIIEFNNFMKQKRFAETGQNMVVRQNEYGNFSNNLGS